MNLIELDKRVAKEIQKRLALSNYQMLNLSWVFGFVVGVSATFTLHWIFQH